MIIQIYQFIKERFPYLVFPCPDESISSWLIRLSRKHYCNTKGFCNYYKIDNSLKSSLDIDSDITLLNAFIPDQFNLPTSLKNKISNFTWIKGRSQWLIDPNRKGSALFNSYTKFCAECLKNKGYFQIKWKFNLFHGCVECGTFLIDSCPKCKNVPSPLRSDYRFPIKENFNPLYYCWFCEFDLRKSKSKIMSQLELNELLKIDKAYKEWPINLRYLTYKQFGTIEGITFYKP